jgi:hypothetical protein
LNAARARQAPRLFLSHGGRIDRQYFEALFGEPDAVSRLAIGQRQSRLAALEPWCLRSQEAVRLFAKQIILAGISLVPYRRFVRAHVEVAPLYSSLRASRMYQSGDCGPRRRIFETLHFR